MEGKRSRPLRPMVCRTCSFGRYWKTGNPNSGSALGAGVCLSDREIFSNRPKAWKIHRRQRWPCTKTGRAPCGWGRNRDWHDGQTDNAPGSPAKRDSSCRMCAPSPKLRTAPSGLACRAEAWAGSRMASSRSFAARTDWPMILCGRCWPGKTALSGWEPLAAACAVCGTDGSQPFPSAKDCRIM